MGDYGNIGLRFKKDTLKGRVDFINSISYKVKLFIPSRNTCFLFWLPLEE